MEEKHLCHTNLNVIVRKKIKKFQPQEKQDCKEDCLINCVDELGCDNTRAAVCATFESEFRA